MVRHRVGAQGQEGRRLVPHGVTTANHVHLLGIRLHRQGIWICVKDFFWKERERERKQRDRKKKVERKRKTGNMAAAGKMIRVILITDRRS